MTYNLRWEGRALDDLTRVWTNGDSALRARITAAAAAVDRLLVKDPTDVGESRAGDEWVVFVGPLGVTYRVPEIPWDGVERLCGSIGVGV